MPETVLTKLEIATGLIFGMRTDGPDPLVFNPAGMSPRATIEQVIIGALTRPPCVVSFSGGRDSSAVLAIASFVARREGLPAPIPVTLRFPDCHDALEDEWQQLVITALGINDWQRLEFHDEMDILGPLAQSALMRHGLLWPFNSYFHQPIFAAAAGGSVITGVGGDELFSAGVWHRENLVLSRRRKPSILDPARLVLSTSPRVLRRAYLSRRVGSRIPSPSWLTSAAADRFRAEVITTLGAESLSFRRTLEKFALRLRSRAVGLSSLNRLASDHGVICVSPFARREVLSAYIASQGWRSFDNRTWAMADLVGDLLPPELISRPTKAKFGSAFFNHYSREFAQSWEGWGVDRDVVDVHRLSELWTSPQVPDAGTFLLMQATWFDRAAGGQPKRRSTDDLGG